MALTLRDLLDRDRDWSLVELVEAVNRLLPDVVPDGAPGRAKAEVNARLVRHYTTEGVLPKPIKDGVEARYAADHLVRVLALRRLLAEGYSSGVAGAFLARHDDEALARFLLGEVRVELDLAGDAPRAEPRPDRAARTRAAAAAAPLPPPEHRADPDAAAPLLRRRSLEGEAWRRPAPAPAAPASLEGGVAWTRYPLAEGLELHVRDGFVDPETPAARARLRDRILDRLGAIGLEREAQRGAPVGAPRATAVRPAAPSAPPRPSDAFVPGLTLATFEAPREGAAAARLEVVLGDVTDEPVDLLVNSTNRGLFGTGGVDGAVHRRAGPELTAACRALPPLEYGRAVVTPGFRLPAARVVHVAVPPWKGGRASELERLDAAYRAAFEAARRLRARSLATPAIGTGTYGYPLEAATEVAVAAAIDELARAGGPDVVRFVVRKGDGLDGVYAAALRAALGPSAELGRRGA